MERVRLRRRRADDLPALAEGLLAQQRTTRYPFRDPLPVPVEQFLHADDALSAWIAELDGRPVGHVCRTGPPAGFPDAAALNDACAAANGCAVDALGWVSTLFVGADVRGRGLGRLLLDAVVDDIRAAGLRPCLEVLPVHPAALALYRRSGWSEVLALRPAWLREAAGEEGPDVVVMVLRTGDLAGPAAPGSSDDACPTVR
ncbi:GNAT family N-acetyltransferase [Nocardioides carbamazepini]|uniref:GNAT family N-acetyltransferase n=1 Tax=Nocardioides carbamazepini TaxID=2854259 RepID=UPI0021499E4A|nr:GNAT family N-acetyltransferase [Nocardioides carbamazepini]MCR1781035.1 GNAT family N-acetyltransferase [Nocardioides carbamazepini]